MMALETGLRANDLKVGVVRNLSDFMQVVALRAAVFMSEQDCPYDEEFDNNDMCACHLIAYLRDEPVATLRIRWFANFAKIERVCVMKHVRGGALVKLMIETAVDMIGRKGYLHILGYIQKRLVPFWKQLGFLPRDSREAFRFSDYEYVECSRQLQPRADALTIDTDPFQLMRPEGDWDHESVLGRSAMRPAVA